MKLLVCGGAGFIGSAFIRRTISNGGADVVCYDKLTYAGNPHNLRDVADDPHFAFVRGDICDRDALRQVVREYGVPDAIVNFAAETHVDRSIDDAAAFLSTDIFGTYELLELVREFDVPKMVQVSTDEVYGSIAEGSATEEAPLRPSSPYAASKAGGDMQALAHNQTYGTPVVITRGSNTYGPYQYPEKLIPLFCTNGVEGLPLPLYGDGLNVRDWLYVDDHCAGVEAALARGRTGEVYNLGGGNERTNREITAIIIDELGLDESAIRRVTDRPGHDRRYSVSFDKARDTLGWEPSTDFDQGIRETVRWYRDNEWWWGPIKHGDEEFSAWQERWYGQRA